MHFTTTQVLGALAVIAPYTDARPVDSVEPSLAEIQRRSLSDGTALKIMPLGASITSGKGSSTGKGYRQDLENLIAPNGNPVSFVGTQSRGNSSHEGYPGYTISEVDDALASSGGYEYIPNVILINAGTNDCGYKRTNPDAAPGDMAALLGHIKGNDPDALVVVSSLLPNADEDTDNCIRTLNPKLEKVTQEAGANGQKTAFVDMYGAVPKSDLNDDGTHPNDDGFAKMAKVWYDGIVGAGNLVSEPDPNGKPAPQ